MRNAFDDTTCLGMETAMMTIMDAWELEIRHAVNRAKVVIGIGIGIS
jgi:hypothetical protein